MSHTYEYKLVAVLNAEHLKAMEKLVEEKYKDLPASDINKRVYNKHVWNKHVYNGPPLGAGLGPLATVYELDVSLNVKSGMDHQMLTFDLPVGTTSAGVKAAINQDELLSAVLKNSVLHTVLAVAVPSGIPTVAPK